MCIRDSIKIDLEKFFEQQPHTVLDGELYNHDLRDDFEQIISLVRKQKPTDEDRLNAHKLIQYHVYDMVAEGPSYEDRLNWLLSSKNLWSDSVISVDTLEVHGYNGAEVVHKVFLNKGYEGSILRLNGPYCLLYTSPSPRDRTRSRMPSSA